MQIGGKNTFWILCAVCSPKFEKVIVDLEKVQKRETKMIRGVKKPLPEESLQKLGLFSLREKANKRQRDRSV